MWTWVNHKSSNNGLKPLSDITLTSHYKKEITSTSTAAVEAAREEARIMRGLDHPNIVTLYSFFIANHGHAYMAMELLNGREVFDLIVDDNEFESLTEMG